MWDKLKRKFKQDYCQLQNITTSSFLYVQNWISKMHFILKCNCLNFQKLIFIHVGTEAMPNDCVLVSCSLYDSFLCRPGIASMGSCDNSHWWTSTFKFCPIRYWSKSKLVLKSYRTRSLFALNLLEIINLMICLAVGLYCTHQDISPEYASILLVIKLTNFMYLSSI